MGQRRGGAVQQTPLRARVPVRHRMLWRFGAPLRVRRRRAPVVHENAGIPCGLGSKRICPIVGHVRKVCAHKAGASRSDSVVFFGHAKNSNSAKVLQPGENP